jgi:outer membrane protein assembly factor BamB
MKSLSLAAVLLAAVPLAVLAALPAPNFIPGQPMLLGSQVLVMWVPVPGAVKYVIYMNGAKVVEVPTNQHILPLPEAAGDYSFQVSAVDAAGKEGAKSTPGIIKVIKLEPPTDIFVRLNEKDKVISLKWTIPKGAVIFDLYRADGKPDNFQLIASVQEDQYQDTKVDADKKYFYRVVAKDIGGKSSPPSKHVEAMVKKYVERVERRVAFKAVAMDPVTAVIFLDDKELKAIGDMRLHPKTGEVWVCETMHKTVYQLNSKGEVVKKHGPFPNIGNPNKFDFGADGKVYLSDSLGGKVIAFDPETDKVIWEVVLPLHNVGDAEYWKGIPSFYKEAGGVAGDVLCLEKEIWVTEQRWGTIFVLDYNGKVLREIFAYLDEGKKVRFPAVGEIGKVGEDKYFITFPLNHFVTVVDKEFKKVFDIGKETSGFTGGFIGIHGVDITKEGNILATDPGLSSIQLFDGKTGAYIQHYGSTGEQDPAQPGRAKVDFGSPNLTFIDRDGRMWFFASNDKTIYIRKVRGK